MTSVGTFKRQGLCAGLRGWAVPCEGDVALSRVLEASEKSPLSKWRWNPKLKGCCMLVTRPRGKA